MEVPTSGEGGARAPAGRRAEKEHPSGDNRFTLLDRAITRSQHRQDSLIEILHTAQELFGYLSEDVLLYISRSLKLPASQVYGVATFYNFFSLEPKGKHTCTVCLGTACYVKGAANILSALSKSLGIRPATRPPIGWYRSRELGASAPAGSHRRSSTTARSPASRRPRRPSTRIRELAGLATVGGGAG